MMNVTVLTPANVKVFRLKGENIGPNARTVARSFTKHAASTTLP